MTAPPLASTLSVTFYLTPSDLTLENVLTPCSIDEGVGVLSLFTFRARRDDLPDDLDALHEIGLTRGAEGEIWRGYIKNPKTTIDNDGAEVVQIDSDGAEIELVWANSYRGIVIDDLDAQDSLDAVLVGSGWTGVIEGTGFPAAVNKRYDNMTVFDMVESLAKILYGYVRFDRINRVVTISNTPPSSGIILAQTTDLESGILHSIKEISANRAQLWNRIIPEAKTDGDTLLTLEESDRSSPYVIQSFTPKSIHIGDIQDLLFSASGAEEYEEVLNIKTIGINRVVVVWAAETSGGGSSLRLKLGGRKEDFIDTESGPAEAIRMGLWVNPPVGDLTVELRTNNPQDVHVVAMALEDVEIASLGIADWSATDTATNTGPDVAVPAHTADKVLFGLGHTAAARVFTSLAGQSRLLTGVDFALDVKLGGTDTIGWTIPTSSEWGVVAFSAAPAKTYYIEDAASITAYSLRAKPLMLGDFKKISGISIEDIANSMYDYAADFLLESKDPKKHYQANVLWLPLGPLDWEVGSEIELDYDSIGTLVVPKRKQVFTEDGSREWQLDLSTMNDFTADVVDTLAVMQQRINAAQFNQV